MCVHVSVSVSVRACVCMSDPRFNQFALGSCYFCQYHEIVHRKEQHAS